MLDYYNIIRNTTPNETIIIEFLESDNYQKIIDIIVEAITSYLNKTSTYTVAKGDSLYQIAKKYKTTVEALKSLNNLTSNTLTIGQKLIIPEVAEEKQSTDTTTYIVVKGDSLYQIAKKFNTTVETLKSLNNLTSNTLSIGQKLIIPASKEDYTIYKVVKGDSLYQIAQKYNTSVDEIKKLNNLSNNTLSIDQELKIPR